LPGDTRTGSALDLMSTALFLLRTPTEALGRFARVGPAHALAPRAVGPTTHDARVPRCAEPIRR